MLGQAPVISETLEWMLQSRQVGEETLVKTLIQEQYAHVYQLVSSLIDSKAANHCEEITEQIIFAAIEDSPGYQGDMEVNAWLSRKSIAVLRKRREPPWKIHPRRMNIQLGSDSDVIFSKVMNWYAELTCEQRVAVSLFFLLDFSLAQIADVMDSREQDAAGLLEAAKTKLPEVGGQLDPIGIKDADIKRTLARFWPVVEQDGSAEKKVAQRILGELHAKEQRKHHLVFFGEAFLAIMAIFFVISLGGLIGRFTPQPTAEIIYETRMVNRIVFVSPTPGPTQSPRPMLEEAIIYEAVGGETLNDIAEKIYFNTQILEVLNLSLIHI